jgi:glycosyltransferase involved in cell wall biosynthesis
MDRRVIGYWYWEIDAFPERWRPALDAVDEIWVASEYVAGIVRRATGKPVIRIPHAFDVALSRRYSRSEFSLPDGKFLFLLTFDFHSFVERKNPLAAIEAFTRAFPQGDDPAALVVKCMQGYRFPQQLDLLRHLAAKDPRILVVDRVLSRDQATGLQSVCDAYVSLHRAEGLGLGMAECMAQGKPVIGTAYSGNLDFMRADNSCLVDYTLIPVRPGDYVDYEPGWLWADPDIDHAARYMRRLVEDPDYRLGLGQRAAAAMRNGYSHGKAGAAIVERLAEVSRRGAAAPATPASFSARH